MAKNNKNNEEVTLTPEQIADARKQMRAEMREKFDKWLTVYDEDATDEDIKAAKDCFDQEVKKYQNVKYVLAKENAAEYVKLVLEWNKQFVSWKQGAWKGVIRFNMVMNELLENYKKDSTLPFEVDYSTLIYMYQTMAEPAGFGLDSAMAMAKFENYDVENDKFIKEDYYVTYSYILQNILEIINELKALDKKLKLMRERINIATAGIKFDWKISEIEEFVELHNTWVGEAVPEK